MSTFRYYLPGVVAENVTPALLAEVGLAERLWDCLEHGNLKRRCAINDVLSQGPDGSSGALVVPLPRSGEPVPRLAWKADQQTAVDHGRYWIVTDNAAPPTPTGLERATLVDGYVRQLGDGSHWQCPIVRSELDQTDLPREYVLQGGEVLGKITARYQAVWLRSVKWCLRFLDQCRDLDCTKFLGVTEAFEGAVDCLALNYRVTAEELACFPGLLTDQSLTSILDAAIDWDFYSDLDGDDQKKRSLQRASDVMQSLLLGPEDCTAPTDPPAPASNSSAAATPPTTAAA